MGTNQVPNKLINLDLFKDEIQNKAVDAFVANKFVGTLELATGSGKTFCFLKILLRFPKVKKVLFLAETTERKTDLYTDIEKFNSIFEVDVLKDRELEFMCYQSAYKLKNTFWDLVCSDEIHDSLTPTYSEFYRNNKYHGLLGLSAKVKKNVYYDKEGYSKGDLLNLYCPVVFKYSLSESVDNNTSKSLNIIIINNQLEKEIKDYKWKLGKKEITTTERYYYDYWHKRFIKYCYPDEEFLQSLDTSELQKFQENSQFLIRDAIRRRSEVLFKAKSKEKIVKKLLDNIQGKTLIFGNSLEALNNITPNVVSGGNKKKEEQNKLIREQFLNGDLKYIASFKKLKQGANLGNFDNTIIHSYYSSETDFIQRFGRQRNSSKEGFVFILKTVETKEEKWLEKALENFKSYTYYNCSSVEEAIIVYNSIKNDKSSNV